MTSFDAVKAFDRQFALSNPDSFPSIYSTGDQTNMTANLSISGNFDLLGTLAACDTETALAPDAYKGRKYVRLIQFWSDTHHFWYDLQTFNDAQWQELKENLESKELTLIFHNAGFDLPVMQGCGITPHNLAHDTMLMSYLLSNGLPLTPGERTHYNLKETVRRELGITLDKSRQDQDWMTAKLTQADHQKPPDAI